MKTLLLAVAATLMLGSGAALADGGGVPLTPFVIWQQEGAAGHRLTPMEEMERAAQQGAIAQSHPVPAATAQNGQATHAFTAQSNRGTYLYPPAQNGGANN